MLRTFRDQKIPNKLDNKFKEKDILDFYLDNYSLPININLFNNITPDR